jgi:hypothetical protein
MKISPYMVIGASGVLAIVAVSLYFYETSPQITDAPPTAVEVENLTPPESNDAEIAAENIAKGINLARVRPDGSAVIAGQAPPSSTIHLIENGRIIGMTTASSSGEWVIVPDEELTEGAHLLSVQIIAPDGTAKVGDMALAVEIPAGGDEIPLVALVPYTDESSGLTKVLQVPRSLEAKADDANGAAIPHLTIRSIQATSARQISISGKAEGGMMVTLTLNDGTATTASLNDEAIYSAILDVDPDDTNLLLKGVLHDFDGEMQASVQLKLTRTQFEQTLSGNALIVVQKGDALWRIAYKTYGKGIRYLDIYRQNKDDIKDPDLIYPDQIFVVPNGG